ncbi:MAG: N-acetylglucosamine-6-phosphate deacetylase [Lachnospiraceae bacterium]|nr:N-acetylglucosamine-6-phosphate deacetylase [Lachnospiraceae bacterium]
MKLTNARILGPDFRFVRGTLELEGNRIKGILSGDAFLEKGDVDLEGKTIIPGLIDVHMHGYGGVACSDPEPEHLLHLGRGLASQGVTGYAATIGSAGDDRALKGIRANAAAKRMEDDTRTGARCLGMHMEGPFLNVEKKGGMDKNSIISPSVEKLQLYMDGAGEDVPVKIMTIAPEIPGAEEVIRYGISRGIHFSMGHTNAVQEEARRAVEEWGASRLTHTFNAMRPLNHREIGVLGYSLTSDLVQCEMISDFVHLKKEICLMMYRVKGADRITVISDSFQLAGVDQSQIPEGIPVIIKDAAYLLDGTLCGSTCTVMTCVRNLVSAGIPLEDAVKMASFNPARDMDALDRVGSIAPGKLADLVILDEDLQVQGVYIDGRKLF